MKEGKFRIMELFFYILIVIIGLLLLFMGRMKEKEVPTHTPLPVCMSVAGRGNHHAAISD